MDYLITTNGYKVLIDPEDWAELRAYKWTGRNERGYIYAYNNKLGKMHRHIMKASEHKKFVDHINGETLDNRKCNLRICDNATNLRNQKVNSDNTSGYKGVHKLKRSGKYQAFCAVNNVRQYLGVFNTAEEAAIAYNEAAKRLHGEFARLNVI